MGLAQMGLADRQAVRHSYNDAYRRPGPLFGMRPDPAIAQIVREHALSGRALDLGAGDGRHSVFLARNGFTVDAVDISEQAVAKLSRLALEEALPIHPRLGDCADPDCIRGPYEMVVADTVLGHFEAAEARRIGARIAAALAPGGRLFATAFAPDDPRRSEFAPLVRAYFEPAQLLALFPGLRTERCEKLALLDRTHGWPHEHRIVRLIAQKEAD
jgi:2-polyprenyl-3-methyl-5-hydroxy-6-metoxy-1,4-benzoquinol methylase